MRLVSNKESVARGEVSILAIVETLLAIALVFYLSAHFNTLRWLAVAMCVSPLLLLRTAESTRLGIEWFDRWAIFVEKIAAPAGSGLLCGLRKILSGIMGIALVALCSASLCDFCCCHAGTYHCTKLNPEELVARSPRDRFSC